MRIVCTLQAKEDLREIKTLMAREAPFTAVAFVQRMRRAVDDLKGFPERGRVVPEIGKPEIREILFGNYRIIYRFGQERVEILTVFHGARLLTTDDL